MCCTIKDEDSTTNKLRASKSEVQTIRDVCRTALQAQLLWGCAEAPFNIPDPRGRSLHGRRQVCKSACQLPSALLKCTLRHHFLLYKYVSFSLSYNCAIWQRNIFMCKQHSSVMCLKLLIQLSNINVHFKNFCHTFWVTFQS